MAIFRQDVNRHCARLPPRPGSAITGRPSSFPSGPFRWRDKPLIEVVSHAQIGVIKEHPGAGKPHNLADFFSHRGPVTVDRATSTGGLVRPERTMFQTTGGIMEKLLAIRTYFPLIGVLLAAVDVDHRLNCPQFATKSGRKADCFWSPRGTKRIWRRPVQHYPTHGCNSPTRERRLLKRLYVIWSCYN